MSLSLCLVHPWFCADPCRPHQVSVLLAPDKMVEVRVRPPHDSLQNPAEFGEGGVASCLELTPDGFVCATKRDFELVNLNGF